MHQPQIDEIIYRGKSSSGENYSIGSEEFTLPSMQYVVKRHPEIRNLFYKWDSCHGSELPLFKVDNAFCVFNDIWRHINDIQVGEYIIIANDPRTMHVYERMLNRSTPPWQILNRGLIYDVQPYLIIRK